MKANPQLKKFLTPYDKKNQSLAIELRDFITTLVPEANELIYDNYNADALAYSKSDKLKDAFCHIAVYSKHLNFGLNRGAEHTKNTIKLEGKGKLIRHIAVKKMIIEAVELSELNNKSLINKNSLGQSLIKSISKKKIRPT